VTVDGARTIVVRNARADDSEARLEIADSGPGSRPRSAARSSTRSSPQTRVSHRPRALHLLRDRRDHGRPHLGGVGARARGAVRRRNCRATRRGIAASAEGTAARRSGLRRAHRARRGRRDRAPQRAAAVPRAPRDPRGRSLGRCRGAARAAATPLRRDHLRRAHARDERTGVARATPAGSARPRAAASCSAPATTFAPDTAALLQQSACRR